MWLVHNRSGKPHRQAKTIRENFHVLHVLASSNAHSRRSHCAKSSARLLACCTDKLYPSRGGKRTANKAISSPRASHRDARLARASATPCPLAAASSDSLISTNFKPCVGSDASTPAAANHGPQGSCGQRNSGHSGHSGDVLTRSAGRLSRARLAKAGAATANTGSNSKFVVHHKDASRY